MLDDNNCPSSYPVNWTAGGSYSDFYRPVPSNATELGDCVRQNGSGKSLVPGFRNCQLQPPQREVLTSPALTAAVTSGTGAVISGSSGNLQTTSVPPFDTINADNQMQYPSARYEMQRV
jgi:hypothetical protein